MRRLLIILLFIPLFSKGQDIHYSQFQTNGQLLNPALAGSGNNWLNAHLNYKSQWSGIQNGYRTSLFGVDMPLLKGRNKGGFLGVGLMASTDKAGEVSMGYTTAGLSLSGSVYINQYNLLTAGIRTNYAQRSLDAQNMQWDSQFDGTGYNAALPGEQLASQSVSFIDVSAGLNWKYSNQESSIGANDYITFNTGLAVDHVTQPEQSFTVGGSDPLNIKYTGYFFGRFDLKRSNLGILPKVAYFRQGKLQELLVGSLVRIELQGDSKYTGFVKEFAMAFGGTYRLNDAIIPEFVLQFGEFSLGFTYDFTVSSLQMANNGQGGFEVSLRFSDITGSLMGKRGSRSML